MKKAVLLKLDVHNVKKRIKAMKTVSGLPDMWDKKLTVMGYIDPVTIVRKLRKLNVYAEIAKEPEKKDGGDKEDPENPEKKDGGDKEDPEKKDEAKKGELRKVGGEQKYKYEKHDVAKACRGFQDSSTPHDHSLLWYTCAEAPKPSVSC